MCVRRRLYKTFFLAAARGKWGCILGVFFGGPWNLLQSFMGETTHRLPPPPFHPFLCGVCSVAAAAATTTSEAVAKAKKH